MITFDGARAVLGTRHGKERVIIPALESALGLFVELCDDLDTDRFGTFTREVPRTKSPIDTAVAKAEAALQLRPAASIGIASEGSFGPYPLMPLVAGGTELVVLVHRSSSIRLSGMDVTAETNFAAKSVASVDAAMVFASTAGFPSHAMVVVGAGSNGQPASGAPLLKGITDVHVLERAVADALRSHGQAWVETDMRAHLNPTRMKSIGRAARQLADAARSRCPSCDRPGYVVFWRIPGLPCADCGLPTNRPRLEVLRCDGCSQEEERPPRGTQRNASPFYCGSCNP